MPGRRQDGHLSPAEQVARLNHFLFVEQRFRGNDDQYYDARNSYLNEVLDRRTGIPISLSVVYMEVGRRAGLHVEGINFPGHFLVRCQNLIVDRSLSTKFAGGARKSRKEAMQSQ